MQERSSNLTYQWLTPGGLAALELLWVEPALLHKAFHARLTGLGPRLLRLHDEAGAEIEHAVGNVVNHGVLLSCHGGPATRAELTRLLEAAGGRQEPVANLWDVGSPLTTAALADIPAVHGDLGVKLLMRLVQSGTGAVKAMLALQDSQFHAVVAALLEARWLFDPPRVQLWGPVNAGKSSLLNALCGENLAAVGPEAGLTRDVIEGRFETDGFVVRVLDAPGAPENESPLDAAAFALARQWRAEADLTLELVPPGRRPSGEPGVMAVYSRADEDAARRSPGLSVNDKEQVNSLRRVLTRHFIGRLLELPETLRVSLPRALLAELSGAQDTRAVLKRHVDT